MTENKLSRAALAFFREQGRIGGLKGGKVRAELMTPAQRKERARKAARARWDRKDAEHLTTPPATA